MCDESDSLTDNPTGSVNADAPQRWARRRLDSELTVCTGSELLLA